MRGLVAVGGGFGSLGFGCGFGRMVVGGGCGCTGSR